LTIHAIKRNNNMTTNIRPSNLKTVNDAQVLIVSDARFQNSAPFSGSFEVFDLDHCITRNEDGNLMATVNCTTAGLPLTEDSTLEIELQGHYESCIGFSGDVITCIAIIPTS
jgi:hypothetical protein